MLLMQEWRKFNDNTIKVKYYQDDINKYFSINLPFILNSVEVW